MLPRVFKICPSCLRAATISGPSTHLGCHRRRVERPLERVLALASIRARKLVQWVILGAPNPYLWCEDAVRCAALRREILATLVPLRLRQPVVILLPVTSLPYAMTSGLMRPGGGRWVGVWRRR